MTRNGCHFSLNTQVQVKFKQSGEKRRGRSCQSSNTYLFSFPYPLIYLSPAFHHFFPQCAHWGIQLELVDAGLQGGEVEQGLVFSGGGLCVDGLAQVVEQSDLLHGELARFQEGVMMGRVGREANGLFCLKCSGGAAGIVFYFYPEGVEDDRGADGK